jgi:Right handed beta helix region
MMTRSGLADLDGFFVRAIYARLWMPKRRTSGVKRLHISGAHVELSRSIAMRSRCLTAIWIFIFMFSASLRATAESVKVNSRDELVQAMQRATPGTTIQIASGEYSGGLVFNNVHGEAGNPIILEAADAEGPPVFVGGVNCIRLTDPAFVKLRNLVLTDATGNGLNIDDGGSYSSPAHHVTLRGITIRDIGPQGNRDGIKLSGVDNFRVENCTLERWGDRGSAIDMVGCHNGTISECSFRYRSGLAANGVQTKGGSSDIVVRRCRFENSGSRSINIGGSTGLPYFRPKVDGFEARDIVVEDCTFIGSLAPICFVGVDGAVVRYNTIYRPQRNVVRILQESLGDQFVPCRNGVFSHNLIAFRSDEIRGIMNIGAGTAAETFEFSSNHWYCIDRPARSNQLSLPVKETDSTYEIDPQFMNVEQGNLRLKNTSTVRDAGVRRK